MTRSFSTCLQATKRSCPSAPSHGRQRTTHPDGGMSECSLTRGALRDYRYDQERLPVVVGVSKDCHHRLSKQPCESITIIFSFP